jgi:predicted transcriptional regulator
MLRRHLGSAHDLPSAEYRERWGLPQDYPLTAPAYSERRSTMAKMLGFGRKPAVTAPETTPPKRRGRPRAAPTP